MASVNWHLVAGVVFAGLAAYGGLGVRKQLRAAHRARGTPRHHTLRVVAGVTTARWSVNVGLVAAAFIVDAKCDPRPGHDTCVDVLLYLMVAAACAAVTAELVGHQLVRRRMQLSADDPGAPAAPMPPLRVVKDEPREGETDGER